MLKFYKNEEGIIYPSVELLDKEMMDVHKEINEKHTPEYEIKDNKIIVKVNHGMSDEHYITAIVYQFCDGFMTIKLNPTDKPEVELDYHGGGILYIICNIHGVYAKSIDLGI